MGSQHGNRVNAAPIIVVVGLVAAFEAYPQFDWSSLLWFLQAHLILHLVGVFLGGFLLVVSMNAFLKDRRLVLLILVGAFAAMTIRDLVALSGVILYDADFILPSTNIETGHAFDIIITGLLAVSVLKK
jgi:hypothetical protein